MGDEGRADEEKSSLKKLEKYLRKERAEYGEVIFLVGKEEERIEESLIILRAFSPIFHDLFRDLPSSFPVSKVIKLPEFQPNIFRIFLQVKNIVTILKKIHTKKLTLKS